LYNDANTGTVASNTFLAIESANRNAVIELSGSAGATNSVNFSDTLGTSVAGLASSIADSNLLFRTGGTTERMRIDSSGNVGFGVVPSAWSGFRAFQQQNTSIATDSGNQFYLSQNWFWNGSADTYIANGFATRYRQSSGTHQWFNAPSGTAGNAITFTQAMTLTAAGDLGIGTTGPNTKLQVDNGANSSFVRTTSTQNSSGFDFGVGGSGDSTAYIYNRNNTPIVFGTNSAERARIDSSGNLLVGTTTAGGVGFTLADGRYIWSLGTYNNLTAAAANMHVASNGSFARSTSALKYKQDVRDLEHIDINKFRPVRYKSRCTGDDQTIDHFGVIADEVNAAGITELVNYGADGEIEGFQYERLTVVLLKAIQEQQQMIEELKAKVAALENA
jgi:hypothetical protein